MLISLRRAMDADLEESLKSAVDSYRSTLAAVADAGALAYPPAGDTLRQSLENLQRALAGTPTPTVLAHARESAGEHLQAWGTNAGAFYQSNAEEVKNLLLLVAKAASDVAGRDQTYGERFQGLAGRLQGAAKLESISAMRQSLTASAAELVECVQKMAEDGNRAVAELRQQVAAYEARTEAAERLACTDALTGLFNRRMLERQLERRIQAQSQFSVLYFDLNGFKQINDTLGHRAGDHILKSFASELTHSLRATDTIARIGGDEFVALVAGAPADVTARLEHIKTQLNGDYTVPIDSGKRKVKVAAAIGFSPWKPGQSAQQILAAADAAMYEDKKQRRK
jgi:diguanylate cyclase (GGDEF)-like protein